MNRAVIVFLLLVCVGCGSNEDASFPGTWNGDLPQIGNNCPFLAPLNQNQIFPVVISSLPNGQLNVVAADGSTGIGIEDEKNNSFLVSVPSFGNTIDNTTPYTGCTVTYDFGFFSSEGSSAESELAVSFDNCIDTTDGSTESCGVLYSGSATKID